MNRLRIMLISSVLLSILFTTTPSIAGGIAKYVEPQPDAPILISGCSGNIIFTQTRWGTYSSFLITGVDFKNVSSKAAVAVLFHLQMSNAFGDIMDNRFPEATGQFNANTTINGNHWTDDDIWPGLSTIRCSVDRVLFSDGSVWKEMAPSPAPSRSA